MTIVGPREGLQVVLGPWRAAGRARHKRVPLQCKAWILQAGCHGGANLDLRPIMK